MPVYKEAVFLSLFMFFRNVFLCRQRGVPKARKSHKKALFISVLFTCLDGLYTEATHGNDIYYFNGILFQLTNMYIAVITYLIQICFKHTKSLGHYYPIS